MSAVLLKPQYATLQEALRHSCLLFHTDAADTRWELLSRRLSRLAKVSGRPSERRQMRTGSHMLRAFVRYSVFLYVYLSAYIASDFRLRNKETAAVYLI